MEFSSPTFERQFQLALNEHRTPWDKVGIAVGQVLCAVVLVRVRRHLHLLYGQFTLASFMFMLAVQYVISRHRGLYVEHRNKLLVLLKLYFMVTAPIAQLEHLHFLDDSVAGGKRHSLGTAIKLLLFAGQHLNMLFVATLAINSSAFHLCFQTLLTCFNAITGYGICSILCQQEPHAQLFNRLGDWMDAVLQLLPGSLDELKPEGPAATCTVALATGQVLLGWLVPVIVVFVSELQHRRVFLARHQLDVPVTLTWYISLFVAFLLMDLLYFNADLIVMTAHACARLAQRIILAEGSRLGPLQAAGEL